MDFWKDCPDDVLITIFKNFDLKTRLKAGLTCRRWYELLKDPRARMEDVYEINFRIKTDIKRWKKNVWQTTLEDEVKTLMEGLSNHLGKAHSFCLKEGNPMIVSLISGLINDGLLKINKFSPGDIDDEDFSITDWVNAILPSSIRELDLLAPDDEQVLDCDWSLLPQLQRLSLDDISIDLSTSSPSSLKYLKMGFSESEENSDHAAGLNTTLSYLPQLEELHISDLHFDDQSFRNFLMTIKNKLSNLCRVYFGVWVRFDFSNTTTIWNEFKYGFALDSLEEIEFFINEYHDGDYPWNWMDVVKLFSRICPAATILVYARVADYDGLPALTTRGNTKLALDLNFGTDDFESLDTPPEFGQALVNLRMDGMESTIFLEKFFNGNSYEKLIEVNFCDCDGLNEKILKIVAQSCPWLNNLNISDCKRMTENGLKSFLIHWEKRQSKKLSITIKQSSSFEPNVTIDPDINSDPLISIDNLFGTSFEEARGILDERWMMEEVNEGPSTKRQKITMENGKRWILYRKTLKAHGCDDPPRIRLVIWDQGNSLNGGDQKILMIKNYNSLTFTYQS